MSPRRRRRELRRREIRLLADARLPDAWLRQLWWSLRRYGRRWREN